MARNVIRMDVGCCLRERSCPRWPRLSLADCGWSLATPPWYPSNSRASVIQPPTEIDRFRQASSRTSPRTHETGEVDIKGIPGSTLRKIAVSARDSADCAVEPYIV